MRKFLVLYRYYLSGYRFIERIISLEQNEKANQETFNKKLRDYEDLEKTAVSWSLIEE